MVDASTLQQTYADPYSSLAVQGVPVGGYDPAEFQADIARMTQIARQKSFDANGELSPELEHLGVNGPQYSQSGLGYFNAINDYLNSQKTGYNLTPQHLNVYNPQTGAYEPLSDAQATAYGASPIANQFYANFNPAANGVKDWETGNIQFAPDQQYRIVDRATGKVLHEGVGYDAGNQITNYATDLTKNLGDQANWIIQKAAPGTSDWTQAYEHIPYKSGLGSFLKVALPLALGPLGGVFGAAGGAGLGLGTVGTGALGAAAGSGLAGVANGDSLGDILKGAALSGVLSYAGGALGGSLGSGAGKVASEVASTTGSTAGSAGGALVGSALDGITVLGNLGGAAGSAIGGGLGSLAGAAGSLATAPANGVTAPDGGDIVVNGIRTATPAATGSTFGGLSGAALASVLGNVPPLTPEQSAQGQQQATDAQAADNPIEVTARHINPATGGLDPLIAGGGAVLGAGGLAALGGGTATAGTAAGPSVVDPENIVVTAAKPAFDTSLAVFPAAISSSVLADTALQSTLPPAMGQQPLPPETLSTDVLKDLPLAALPAAMGNTVPPAPDTPPATPPDSISDHTLDKLLDAAPLAALPAAMGNTVPPATTATPKTTLQKVIDALTLAGLGSNLIGGLLGGNGNSGGLGGVGGSGSLSPTFTSSLPTASIPGGVGTAANLAARTMPQQDWYKYAMRPEQSFFNYVPQAYTPPLPGQTDQWTHLARGGAVEAPDYDYTGAEKAGVRPDERGHLPDTYKLPNHMTFSDDSIYSTPQTPGGKWRQSSDGKWVFWPSEFNMQQHPMGEMQDYFSRVEPDSPAIYPSDFRLKKAVGGPVGGGLAVKGRPAASSLAVRSGRSDDIPAMLSDGEYVMDAETVAMLGDGSNKAGADKLDQFRVNLRKHKGRQMAKGKFSLSAKAPEAYMAGGRT